MDLSTYLSGVLHQTGHEATPYAERSKPIIKEHLIHLQEIFPYLGIRKTEFHANDGRMLHLLKAEGTIPMHYQGNKYNLPIIIWLTTKYPDESPLVYVTPVKNMMIKPGHPNVDRSGQVNCPPLDRWTGRSSNLVDLCLHLSQMFGQDPPLYSAPPGGVPPPSQPSTSQSGAAVYRPPVPGMSAAGTIPYPPNYPAPQANPLYPQSTGSNAMGPPASGAQYPGQAKPVSPAVPGAGPPQPPSAGSVGPFSFPIATTSSQSPPPPSQNQPSTSSTASLAAANPLWGAAFLAAQQAVSARPGTSGSSGSGAPATAIPTSTSLPSTSGTYAASGIPFTGAPPPGLGGFPSHGSVPMDGRTSNNGPMPHSSSAGALNASSVGLGPGPLQAALPSQSYTTGLPGLYPSPYTQSLYGQPQNVPPPPPSHVAPYGSQPATPGRQAATKAEVASKFRPVAMAALKGKLEAAAASWSEAVASNTNRLLEEQRQLTEHKAQLQAALTSLKQERAGTELLVSEMGGKQAQLAAWLERNEPKAAAWQAALQAAQQRPDGQLDWDSILPAADDLSRQALEAQAADAAAEDVVVALERALFSGCIPSLTLDVYLRQVRLLYRKQYLSRTLAQKIAELQQHQHAPMPGPPQGTNTQHNAPRPQQQHQLGAGFHGGITSGSATGGVMQSLASMTIGGTPVGSSGGGGGAATSVLNSASQRPGVSAGYGGIATPWMK